MRIAIAQHNPVVGDVFGNTARLLSWAEIAYDQGAHLLVCPELALCGYPPRDLLERPAFVKDNLLALKKLVEGACLPIILGAVVSAKDDALSDGGPMSNAAVVIAKNKIVAIHRKVLLPNYDIFDEPRYFVAGQTSTIVRLNGICFGLTVCEDIWNDKDYFARRRYDSDPVQDSVAAGAEVLINISASPFDRNKATKRLDMLRATCKKYGRPLVYVNQVGANDSLIFDGRSVAIDAQGKLCVRLKAFADELKLIDYNHDAKDFVGPIANEPVHPQLDVADALCLGLRDYMTKTGHQDVVLGLSGGIDSALVAALAVRSLSNKRVRGIALPSRYSSEGSITDARQLAASLSIDFEIVAIEPCFVAMLDAVTKPFLGRAHDVAEENLQARIRGTLLMAYANKFSSLLLTTGNKSEVAVGYCTLYGDMNGGLGLISDLYKTEVYALARFLNEEAGREIIPSATLTKPPSAELRPNQKDADSLPAYDDLDRMLRAYVDEARSIDEVVAMGFEPNEVKHVASLIAKSEHKRRQMAPGLRISEKAFGEGRRLPVAQRWGF